jgi:hypothetical protein
MCTGHRTGYRNQTGDEKYPVQPLRKPKSCFWINTRPFREAAMQKKWFC